MFTRIQEKGAGTPQKTDPDLPISVQESPAEAWVGGGLCRVGSSKFISGCMESFEEGHHYVHYLQHSLAPGN